MLKENRFKFNRMKKIIILFTLLLNSEFSFSQNRLTLEIEGVKKQSGKVYVSVFDSEESFKLRKFDHSYVVNPDDEVVSLYLNLPTGECLFSIYQDVNSNGKIDTYLLGIPKEPFGFSNYNGKSVPGNFNQHKVIINEKTKKVIVQLHKL